MRTPNINLTVCCAAILFAACNSAQNIPTDERPVELRLSSALEKPSRGAFSSSDTQIDRGETVAVWVYETGGAQQYGNQQLTADGLGGLAGSAKMYFPESRNNADIYAIHTNATLTGNAYPSAEVTHTVAEDQSTRSGYVTSDLFYARRTNIERTSSAVSLTFYHLLSKIQIAVMPGNGLTESSIKGITIGGVRRQALFTLDKAGAPEALAVTAGGEMSSITIGADVSSSLQTPKFNDAVVVPQSMAARTAFITVHLASGDLIYRLPEDVVFQSGKRYIYKLVANLAEITLTSSIVDWTPINPVSGSAVLE